ncbi:MAG: homoserine dehydrogenase [Nitrospinota bacterium]
MERRKVLVCGFGRVGRTFARLLGEKREALRRRYRLDLVLVGAADLDGTALAPPGGALEPEALCAHFEAGGKLGEYGAGGEPSWRGEEAARRAEGDVWVETTPTDLATAEPALTHIRAALGRGLHVVSANKGPLIEHLSELQEQARARGVALKLSAAAAAALPTLDVGLLCLAGAEILALEGVLNGTTNFILSQMEEGTSYAEALARAQRAGIAEGDPSLDVGGWDTAHKLRLIAEVCMGARIAREELPVEGIVGVGPERLGEARRGGKVLKLVGEARREGDGVRARVGLRALDRSHPLAGVGGAEKALTFTTDTMDRVTVMGGKSDPRGAAAALLKDIVNIYRPGP